MAVDKNTKNANPTNPTPATPPSGDGLMYSAPAEAGNAVDSYLYRAGRTAEPGTFKNKKGQTKAHCGTVGIQGYLWGSENRDSDYNEEDGMNLIHILLTKPTRGIQNEEVKIAPVGSIVKVVEKADLRNKNIKKYADDQVYVVEVYLQPTGKMVSVEKGEMEEWTMSPILRDGVPVKVLRSTLKVSAMPALPSRDQSHLPALPAELAD